MKPNKNQQASQWLQALDPTAPLAQRHLWLAQVLTWVRGDARHPDASVQRVQQLLDAMEHDTTWPARWHSWWQQFTQEVSLTPLLADHGFAPRTSFLSEFSHRLGRKLMPRTPDTTDIGELFDLLFPHPADAHWLRALDPTTLERMHRLLFSDTPNTTQDHWSTMLADAVVFAASQISAAGFAAEIRVRMSPQMLRTHPFQELQRSVAHLRETVVTLGPHASETQAACDQVRHWLDTCRHAAYTVYAHLEAHGISVGIVFRLRQLRERVLRIRQLLDALQAPEPARATRTLLAHLVQVSHENRSLRALVTSSAQLTAAKVAERSAESGEHYITRNRAEYHQMLRQAAGGGALIGLTTWAKFALGALGLSAFWAGLATGLNYALSFVLVQLLHFTVATKQPAVTAPAMAAKLRHIRQPHALRAFVDEVAHLLRSQIAAIIGNLGLVVPTVLLISHVLLLWAGAPMIDEATAHYVLKSLHILGPTGLFAAFTGVLLFSSSIVAGWVENWFVFHRLDSALAHHPRLTGLLGTGRAARWAAFLRRHISGFAANISLGLMLGLVPAFASFFGLGLEVRHVTLSAGQLAAACVTLGLEVLTMPAFWWAFGGVLLVGPLNLIVSFYLAFRLALKAQNIGQVHRSRIRTGIWHRLRHDPMSFLRPPIDTAPPATHHG
jgi:site-specific recombinase